MRMSKVAYGFTFNIGNFQSERLDCEVEIQEGESPEVALDSAKTFVLEQHERAEVERKEHEEKAMVRQQIKYLQTKRERLGEKLAARGISDMFELEPPENMDMESLEGLRWRESASNEHLVSLQEQLDHLGQDNIPF